MERAPLSDYIKRCHYGRSSRHSWSFRETIFDQGITHRPPRLDPQKKNRILFYPGAFNPPHRGHEKLLSRAFASSRDMNVVAAIILLLDDKYVQEKARAAGDGLAFTREQRVKLWRGDVPHDWCWVYDRSEKEWETFRQELTACMTRDGYEVEFIGVFGPDQLQIDASPPWSPWGCQSMISSDVSRSAKYPITRGQLRECEPWQNIVWNYTDLTEHVKKDAAYLVGGMALIAPRALEENMSRDEQYYQALMGNIHQDHIDRLKEVKICHRQGYPSQSFRFIQAGNEDNNVHTSSTEVRRILSTCRKEDIVTLLGHVVIYPSILAEIMAEV